MKRICLLVLFNVLIFSQFNVKGIDPTKYLLPESDVELKHMIDSVSGNYYLDARISLDHFYLKSKDTLNQQLYYGFITSINIHDDKNNLLYSKAKRFTTILDRNDDEQFSRRKTELNFQFNLKTNHYNIYVYTEDLTQGLFIKVIIRLK